MPQASAALLNGSSIAAKTDWPVCCSYRDFPNSAAADALLYDIGMTATARGAPGPAVIVAPGDSALLPAGPAGLESSRCPAVAVLADTAVLTLMGKDPALASAASAAGPGDVRQLSGKGVPKPLNQWRRRVVLNKRTAGTQPFRDPAPGHPAEKDIRDDCPRQLGAGPDLKDRVLDEGCVRFVGAGVTAHGICKRSVESGRTHRFPGIRVSGLGSVGVTGPAGTAGRWR